MRNLLLGLLAYGMSLFIATGADAESKPLPPPTGPILLTVTGQIGVTNTAGAARFDAALLRAFEQVTVTSYTDWTEGPQRFSGVWLRDLLQRVEAQGETLVASALNDYSAEIPLSDAAQFPVLLAMRQNGERLTVRTKGPIWIIYVREEPSAGRNPQHNAKMVWQLDRLHVK